MNYKNFIKLGNQSFNLNKIDYIKLNSEDLTVSISLSPGFESIKFNFDSLSEFNRFNSYIKLFSTDFNATHIDVDNPPIILKD